MEPSFLPSASTCALRRGATCVTMCVALLVIVGGGEARAQVPALGKGFLIDGPGTLTSDPNEVISGRNSIKGSYSGAGSFTQFLLTDPTFIRFVRSQTYTITLRYRVLAQGTRGFEFGFFSDAGSREGRFVRSGFFSGATGTSGTATLTARLEAYDDYTAGFKIEGTGAVAVDDIRITDEAGRLVVSENAEGPTLVPGPWNLQLTDATHLHQDGTAFFLRTAVPNDLDDDGYPEAVLTLADTHNNSTTPSAPIIVQAHGQLRIATADFFPAGTPTVKMSPMTLFADLNGDGLKDILFSESGSDINGPGSAIGVGLNLGGGKYRNVQPLIPASQQGTRSYAIAVGDVLGEGRTEIILPDKEGGANTALLRWNGSGFDEIRNWIPQAIWGRSGPYQLHRHSWMNLADFDGDGKQDLLVSGQQGDTNITIVFGASGGFSTVTTAMKLPDGPWGHFDPGAKPPAAQGAEVQPIVVADFNNDGRVDIFASERKVVEYQPGAFTDATHPSYADLHKNGGTVYSDDSFQVFINQGARRFVDVTAPNYVNLGDRTYFSLLPIDINNDGFLDIVGGYQAVLVFKSVWGTTFFLNDGTGRFQPVDGSQVLGATTTPSNGELWNLGSFVPTVITPERIEGIVVETVGINCRACTGLNIYKVVGNGSLGTGPNFADSAKLGVAGFNEFFYLNQHPDVAAAVQRGEYRSGLDNYLVDGRAKGYAMHAPNARVRR